MDVAHGMHDMHVAVDARRAADLQHVQARRGEHEHLRLQKAERRIGRVGFSNVAGMHAVQSGGKDGILGVARQIRGLHPPLFQCMQNGPEGRPVGRAFGVKRERIVL